MNIIFRSRWGELKTGTAQFSKGRGKKTVGVRFDPPLVLGWPTMGQTSGTEEFNLLTGRRYVWGQGCGDDVDDWTMDEKDRVHILETGGG